MRGRKNNAHQALLIRGFPLAQCKDNGYKWHCITTSNNEWDAECPDMNCNGYERCSEKKAKFIIEKIKQGYNTDQKAIDNMFECNECREKAGNTTNSIMELEI